MLLAARQLAAGACVCALFAPSVSAFEASPDVDIDLAGTAISRADIIDDPEAVSPMPIDLGPLPAGAQVVAYTVDEDFPEVSFFVLDSTTELPGGVIATPRNVIAYEASVYMIEVDLGAFGLAEGVAIDALSIVGSDVGFSFDTATELLGVYVEPADVFDVLSSSLLLDASEAGVAPGANLDALGAAPDGNGMIVSFDTGGEVAGIVYADEDQLRVTTLPSYSWAMEVDASAIDPAWERADTDALHYVPEPAQLLQLLAGGLGLIGLGRLRRTG